jgi:hypothetical protein
MHYKKVGGIHFVKIWRFGFNFYLSRSRAQQVDIAVTRAFSSLESYSVRSRVNANGQRVFG